MFATRTTATSTFAARAGQRVMESITRFITQKLKLKVKNLRTGGKAESEKLPFLRSRYRALGLPRVNDDEIRVNVVPKPMTSNQHGDNGGLTTPLSVTGAPHGA